MLTLNTPFGIIRKVISENNVTFVIPTTLSGKKLQSLIKKHKEFFSNFVVIPLTKEETKQKELSKINQLFLSSFCFVSLSGYNKILNPDKIVFFASLIIGIAFASLLISYFVYLKKQNSKTEKVSFNDINQNW